MSDKGSRSELAVAICAELISLIRSLPNKSFMQEYRQRSVVLGQRVTFTENEKLFEGLAQSISDNGALSVLLDNGKIHELKSGEISLRLKNRTQNMER